MNEKLVKQMETINRRRESGEISSREAMELKMKLLGVAPSIKRPDETTGCST